MLESVKEETVIKETTLKAGIARPVHPIWKKTENMDVVRLKNSSSFPDHLIPIAGNYMFGRFHMESDKCLKIIDKILEIGAGKLSEKDIVIYRYNREIVAIRVKINELNGYLNIFEMERNDYTDRLFCISLNTGLSIPIGYDLKEIKSKILVTVDEAGLEVSGKSNIFTPTLYVIKDMTADTKIDDILTMIPDFVQKIKVFEDIIRYPTFFVDT